VPASSITPMVTTALYLVLEACKVEEVPQGFRVALRPSVLTLTGALVSCVAQLVKVVDYSRSPSSPRRSSSTSTYLIPSSLMETML
jgi:hypothetical protein